MLTLCTNCAAWIGSHYECVSRYNAGVARRVLLVAQPGDKRAEVLSRLAADHANPRISYFV